MPESVLLEIEGAHAVVQPAHTVLRGSVANQAALRDIIDRIQQLGLELMEVRRLTDVDPAADPMPPISD